MKISLKKSKSKELLTLAEIYMDAFSKPPYNEKWNLNKSIGKMKFFNKFYDLYTIRLDKEIVGFIVINPTFMCPGEVAFGEEIAIKEEFRNRGIGTQVCYQIFKIYKKKGFKKFMGIAAKKGGPMGLYKRLGILPSKKGVLIEKRLLL